MNPIVSEETRERDKIARLSRSLYERGLTAGSSGNISVRLSNDDGWLLTPTNSCLGELDPARISRLDWQGHLLAGDPPSKEAFLHRSLYEARPKAGAVVHLHSTHAAAVSCLAGLDPADCIPPLTPYFVMKIGRLPLVPYHRPGDPAFGEAIRELAGRHGAVLLTNHGPVVSGPDLQGATYREQGFKVTTSNWRGVFLGKDVPQAAKEFWGKKVAELTATQEWKDELKKQGVIHIHKDAKSFYDYIKADQEMYTTIYKEMGIAK